MNGIFEWLEDNDNKAKLGWACFAISVACGVLSIWIESPKLAATGALFFVTTIIVAVAAS